MLVLTLCQQLKEVNQDHARDHVVTRLGLLVILRGIALKTSSESAQKVHTAGS